MNEWSKYLTILFNSITLSQSWTSEEGRDWLEGNRRKTCCLLRRCLGTWDAKGIWCSTTGRCSTVQQWKLFWYRLEYFYICSSFLCLIMVICPSARNGKALSTSQCTLAAIPLSALRTTRPATSRSCESLALFVFLTTPSRGHCSRKCL